MKHVDLNALSASNRRRSGARTSFWWKVCEGSDFNIGPRPSSGRASAFRKSSSEHTFRGNHTTMQVIMFNNSAIDPVRIAPSSVRRGSGAVWLSQRSCRVLLPSFSRGRVMFDAARAYWRLQSGRDGGLWRALCQLRLSLRQPDSTSTLTGRGIKRGRRRDETCS
jgi:hypothetical protein